MNSVHVSIGGGMTADCYLQEGLLTIKMSGQVPEDTLLLVRITGIERSRIQRGARMEELSLEGDCRVTLELVGYRAVLITVNEGRLCVCPA